jgi:hypothetical protein
LPPSAEVDLVDNQYGRSSEEQQDCGHYVSDSIDGAMGEYSLVHPDARILGINLEHGR